MLGGIDGIVNENLGNIAVKPRMKLTERTHSSYCPFAIIKTLAWLTANIDTIGIDVFGAASIGRCDDVKAFRYSRGGDHRVIVFLGAVRSKEKYGAIGFYTQIDSLTPVNRIVVVRVVGLVWCVFACHPQDRIHAELRHPQGGAVAYLEMVLAVKMHRGNFLVGKDSRDSLHISPRQRGMVLLGRLILPGHLTQGAAFHAFLEAIFQYGQVLGPRPKDGLHHLAAENLFRTVIVVDLSG